MESEWPTVQIYYRCDKIVKDYHEGDILWMGPSEQYLLVTELPRDVLSDSIFMDLIKLQIFFNLGQKSFVKALLHRGDYIGMGPWDILYKSDVAFFYRYSKWNQENLSLNEPIDFEEDELGFYGKLWITMTLVINSQ